MEMEIRSDSLSNKPAPQHAISIVEDAGLAGGDAFLRRIELRHRHHIAGQTHPLVRGAGSRVERTTASTGKSTGAPSPSQLRPPSACRTRSAGLRRGPTDHLARIGVDAHHEQRIAERDIQSAPLADGVAGDAFVAAQHPAGVEGGRCRRASAPCGRRRSITVVYLPSGTKQMSWLSGFFGHRQAPSGRGGLAHGALGQGA